MSQGRKHIEKNPSAQQPAGSSADAAGSGFVPGAGPDSGTNAFGANVSGAGVSGSPASDPIDLQPPRGTRDFYPDEMRRRNWLFGLFRETAARFGFEEVDAPMVEHASLFTRKAGEEIVHQLYHFVLPPSAVR